MLIKTNNKPEPEVRITLLRLMQLLYDVIMLDKVKADTPRRNNEKGGK